MSYVVDCLYVTLLQQEGCILDNQTPSSIYPLFLPVESKISSRRKRKNLTTLFPNKIQPKKTLKTLSTFNIEIFIRPLY